MTPRVEKRWPLSVLGRVAFDRNQAFTLPPEAAIALANAFGGQSEFELTRHALRALIISGVLAAVATPSFAFFHDEPDIKLGRNVYQEACGSCHGAHLEGQPNWQSALPTGVYPAPPHDETGHTWHHGDGMLFDYIRKGGQFVLDQMDVDFMSGMPAFGDHLSDAEIDAVLAYIKSTWPATVRTTQEDRTRMEAASE